MGGGFSGEEDDGQEDDSPKCDARYLHWLLSDERSVQEAFLSVWRGCAPDGGNIASKAKALETLLRVVHEFERGSGEGGPAIGKMKGQLSHAVEALPDKLTRSEALHLFRTALLSLQTALVVKPGASVQYCLQPLGRGTGAVWSEESTEAPSSPNVADVAMQKRSVEAYKMSLLRKTAKGEDLATTALCPRLPPPAVQVLPSRQELEMENEQMRSLSEEITASNREELNVVRVLEEEMRVSRANASSSSGPSESPRARSRAQTAMTDAEVQSELAGKEIARLEASLKARASDLKSFETEVYGQRRDINALLSTNHQEEVSADETGREARDLAAELKTCKRTCGILESQIASEEVRASALQEAFEGRRARYTTAETAARNAELSTMRATRRRVAAESAVHREEQAVEEARLDRLHVAASSSSRTEALECELSEVRRCVDAARSMLRVSNAADRLSTTTKRTLEVEASLQATHAELAQVQLEHGREVAIEQRSANETAQLEVSRARLQERCRSELQSRSVTGQSANGSAADGIADDREAALTIVTMSLVEKRVAEMRHREEEVEAEVHQARNAVSENSDVLWQRAREIATELGDARAALVRRQAQERNNGSEGVVETLREALQETEAKDAHNSQELAQLRNQAANRGSAQARPEPRRGDTMDSNTSLRAILKHIDSVRNQANAMQPGVPSQGSHQLHNLQDEVKSLETALDDKEEVILKLERLSSQLDEVRV